MTAGEGKMKRFVVATAVFMIALSINQARAAVLSVGATSDDWGDPAIGLSGDPNDIFLRVFGVTNLPGFPIRRGALEFDISSVGSGSVISSATLFFADRGTTVSAQMQLHGYSGDGLVQTPDLNDGTFLSFFNVDTSDENRNFNIDVTAFVQSLVGVDFGFAGFMLRATTEGSGEDSNVFNGADFASREFPDSQARPLLTINFQAGSVPAPGTLALFGIGLAGLAFSRRSRVAR
jgi:opacity protein-like surface antigen